MGPRRAATPRPALSSPFSHTRRSLAQDRVVPALWAWGLAALGLAAWAGWFWLGRVAVVEVSQQARLEVSQAAQAVMAPRAGLLATPLPTLGRSVKAGELLATLDAGPEALRLQEEAARRSGLQTQLAELRQELASRHAAATLDADAAHASLQGAQARVDETTAALDRARDTERRLSTEAELGGVSRAEALQARTEARKLDAARSALQAEQRRLAADTGARAAQQRAVLETTQRQLTALAADLAGAQAAEQRLTLELARHQLRAPVDGQVAEVASVHAGEYVTAGQRLVTVLPAGELIAVAEFAPGAVLGRVRPGQAAVLRLEGFPWAEFGGVPARVSRVAAEPRDQRLRVELKPEGPWPAGIPAQHGLPGAVEVQLESVAPATLLLRAIGLRLTGQARAPA